MGADSFNTPISSTTDRVATSTSEAGGSKTYGQILKSSALIGGSSVINIAIGIMRTKATAILLGPAGFGLMSLYNSVADLVQSIAGMGVNSSGVRQIAESVGSGDTARIARTVVVLRRTMIALGIMGALGLVALSKPVSIATFGSDQYVGSICLLSLSVFFRCVSAGQGALVQGLRRIADMAKGASLGTLAGAIATVLLIYLFREKGVVPSLVAGTAMACGITWYYSRKVQIEKPDLTITQTWQESKELLKLGFAFMASGFLTMGAAYVIRILVLHQSGLEAAGLYQSAWAIGGLYVGFILQAMGADFYPRLTAVAKDNAECNRLVNEQTLIGLLIAVPGVIGTITFSPWVTSLFYSAKFAGAIEPLRWIGLGMFLRVVAWPMGFIVLAKNAQKIFIITELVATLVHIGLAWLGTSYFKLTGATMAFFGLYVWHAILMYWIVRRMTGFRWTEINWKIMRLFVPLIGIVFVGFQLLSSMLALMLGAAALGFSGIYSIRTLARLVPPNRLPHKVRALFIWFRLVPPEC